MSLMSELIVHLLANTETDRFVTIAEAWDSEPIDGIEGDIPMLLVFPGKDEVEGNTIDFFVHHQVGRHMQVYLVTNKSTFEDDRDDLRDAMLGWQRNSVYEPTELVSGDLIQIKGSIVWWLDIYLTKLEIRQDT